MADASESVVRCDAYENDVCDRGGDWVSCERVGDKREREEARGQGGDRRRWRCGDDSVGEDVADKEGDEGVACQCVARRSSKAGGLLCPTKPSVANSPHACP
jgi:hypothetical protein